MLVPSPCKSWHSLRYVSSSNQFVTRPCFENVESNAIRPVRRFLSRNAQLTRQCMRFDAKKRSIFIPNLLLFSSLESLLGVHNLWLCGNYQCSWWDPWTLHWIFIHRFSQHSFGSCSYILASWQILNPNHVVCSASCVAIIMSKESSPRLWVGSGCILCCCHHVEAFWLVFFSGKWRSRCE